MFLKRAEEITKLCFVLLDYGFSRLPPNGTFANSFNSQKPVTER